MSECPECQLRRTVVQGGCSLLLELPSPLGSAFVSLACFRCGEYILGWGLHHCIIITHTEIVVARMHISLIPTKRTDPFTHPSATDAIQVPAWCRATPVAET